MSLDKSPNASNWPVSDVLEMFPNDSFHLPVSFIRYLTFVSDKEIVSVLMWLNVDFKDGFSVFFCACADSAAAGFPSSSASTFLLTSPGAIDVFCTIGERRRRRAKRPKIGAPTAAIASHSVPSLARRREETEI